MKGHLGIMPNFKKKLTAAEFASIGDLALHERWQLILAEGMRVDPATVQTWEKNGTPEDITERLRTFLGARGANIDAALDLMLEKPFSPWERGAEILSHYEGLSRDPTMIYSGFEDNRDMVVRVVADLLHYCMDKITTTRTFIDMDAVIQDAIALYNSEPHSATPMAKHMQQRAWLSKELIPYVLTKDPAVASQFQRKFGITQDQAVDELIEKTDWGQDVPNYVGNKGNPASRLEAIRRALRAGGITDDEK
jgi:hypothetical protein